MSFASVYRPNKLKSPVAVYVASVPPLADCKPNVTTASTGTTKYRPGSASRADEVVQSKQEQWRESNAACSPSEASSSDTAPRLGKCPCRMAVGSDDLPSVPQGIMLLAGDRLHEVVEASLARRQHEER